MSTLLEPPRVTRPAEPPSLPAVDAAPVDDLLWEDSEDLDERFPWLRLIAIGIVLGFLIGLPLIPTSGTAFANLGEIAGAYGCPFHAPSLTDTRSFTIAQ